MIIIYRSNICSDLLSARNEIKKVKGTEQGSYGKAKKQLIGNCNKKKMVSEPRSLMTDVPVCAYSHCGIMM